MLFLACTGLTAFAGWTLFNDFSQQRFFEGHENGYNLCLNDTVSSVNRDFWGDRRVVLPVQSIDGNWYNAGFMLEQDCASALKQVGYRDLNGGV